MLKKQLYSALAVFALVGGVAACGGEEVEEDAVVTDVVTEPEMETVEVPVVTQDTAVVTTDVNVEVDTVDVGEGEAGAGVR